LAACCRTPSSALAAAAHRATLDCASLPCTLTASATAPDAACASCSCSSPHADPRLYHLLQLHYYGSRPAAAAAAADKLQAGAVTVRASAAAAAGLLTKLQAGAGAVRATAAAAAAAAGQLAKLQAGAGAVTVRATASAAADKLQAVAEAVTLDLLGRTTCASNESYNASLLHVSDGYLIMTCTTVCRSRCCSPRLADATSVPKELLQPTWWAGGALNLRWHAVT
jgi:hypothetical protein